MISAFASGGCFHSRTAMGMFEHVRAAVVSGECLLEWDYSKGEPSAPLLKDCFGLERRRAKVLNFSIAYGKTAHGLSKDWGVSQSEAQDMVNKWYADRPEVLEWQKRTIETARKTGATRTLMNRYRRLHGINSAKAYLGGAADLMTLAMLKLRRSKWLRDNGFTLLLQIH